VYILFVVVASSLYAFHTSIASVVDADPSLLVWRGVHEVAYGVAVLDSVLVEVKM